MFVLAAILYNLLVGGLSVGLLAITPFTAWGIRSRDLNLEAEYRNQFYSWGSVSSEIAVLAASVIMFLIAFFVDIFIVRWFFIAVLCFFVWHTASIRMKQKNTYRTKVQNKRPLPLVAYMLIDVANTATAVAGILSAIYILTSIITDVSPTSVIDNFVSQQESVEVAQQSLLERVPQLAWENFVFGHFLGSFLFMYARYVNEQWEDNGIKYAGIAAVFFYPLSLLLIHWTVAGAWYSIPSAAMFMAIWVFYSFRWLWNDKFEAYDVLQENHNLYGLILQLFLFGTGQVESGTYLQMVRVLYLKVNEFLT